MEAVIGNRNHVGRLLEARAIKYGDKTYLAWYDERYTYREVNRLADCYRAGLEQAGVEPGSPVRIMMRNCPEYVESRSTPCVRRRPNSNWRIST